MITEKGQKLKIKYNRVSTLSQTGDRFSLDKDNYDMTLFDKVSGSIAFKERPKGKEIVKMVDEGIISDLVCESLDRMGRNTGDVIKTLEWLEKNEINVHIRNIGLQSRQNGKKNPIWKMITTVMSSLYETELENIRERTQTGKIIYIQKGGILGRPCNSKESEKQFLEKEKTKEIIKWLNKNRTVREISSHTKASNKTIIKAKRIGAKYGLVNQHVL
jgi:DNA invertase Pin-like site-specific DNA recombinase